MSDDRDIPKALAPGPPRVPAPPRPRVSRPPRLLQSRVLALVFVLAAVLTPSAAAQTFTYRGYVKNLAVRSQSILTDEALFLDVSRGRIEGALDAGVAFHAEVWLDTELLLGGFLRSPDFALGQGFARTTLFDLDWTLSDDANHVLRQSLFRAFATVTAGRLRVTAGRQRIAWGTGFVWTPTDLLNPINPTAIERDEKAGVDAVYAELAVGPLSRIEAVVAPGPRAGTTSAAVRASANVREYDVSGMLGVFRDDVVLGGDFAGYVRDAGLRGEIAYTFPDVGASYLRASLNADYTFRSGYYVLAELHHNGPGSRDAGRYDVTALLDGTVFNLAREYGALSVAKTLTPLVGANVYTLVNLNDGSGLAGPALTWSVRQNVELFVSAYVFFGPTASEFGTLENVYFGALQVYF